MNDVSMVTYLIDMPRALANKLEEATRDAATKTETFILLAIAEKLSRLEHEAWLQKKRLEDAH